MPVITAAVAAIGAAVATTTVATVAAAVVATSAAIGTIGLAVGAIGLATGNKDLMKAGSIMGMVGVAGGLAGMGAGALAGAESVASQFANPELAGSIAGNISQAGQVGAGTVLAPGAAAQTGVGAGTVLAPAGTGMIAASPPPVAGDMGAASSGPGSPQLIDAPKPEPMIDPSKVASSDVVSQAPLNGSAAPAAPQSSMAGTQAPSIAQDATNSINQAGQVGAGTVLAPGAGSVPPPPAGASMGDWWKALPDWQKSQVMIMAGQGVSGMAGGWFQGLSAEKQIELNRLIADRDQTQRQYLNANNAYAPRISFNKPSGLIGQRSA